MTTTITIADVLAEQAKINAMIQALQTPASPIHYLVPEASILLQPGEVYAGLVLDAEGCISHHLVLLPGEAEDVNWQAAIDWATSIGGVLPTRQEQALLYANRKGDFQPRWYWSAESHEDDGSYAWNQYFYDGTQDSSHKSYEGRARAVRRVTA